jgi:hypothetical protein
VPLLHAEEIFACLARHQVAYVLIGGLAAVLRGSPLPTVDADICPESTQDNLRRLAQALADLSARVRTPDAPGGVPFPYDAAFLSQVQLLNLVTRAGDLDLSFMPAGTHGYADLAASATTMTIDGVLVPVASLEDVIRSKEAANRPKDARMLPTLRQLLDEIRRRERKAD